MQAGAPTGAMEKSRLLAHTGSRLATFLHSPGPPGQGLVPLIVGWALLHQLIIKPAPPPRPTGQSGQSLGQNPLLK